ncbi:MAG: triple tyrosine motif-containing protein, partial [Paludibacter sp.]|nr:triple tyrosine motif-containing protein [Paludibacter sp.]
ANYPMVRNFTRNIYKAGAQNWGIVQDKLNKMYFANNTGLLEFDGKNWTTYPIMNGTDVRSILYDGDGRIYASTFNEFGYYQRQEDNKLHYISLLSKMHIQSVGSNELYNIHKGNGGEIFFQSKTGVYAYEKDTLVCYSFKNIIDASGVVNGELYITSSQSGVYLLVGKHFFRIPDSEMLINKKVCSILPFGNKNVMFVTSLNGVYLFDGNSITHFKTGIDDFLINNQVFCAATNGSQIVFGTVQKGIAVLNIYDKSVVYNNTYTGLQNNTVLSVAFDNQQNLWLGLDKGIDYVMLNSPISNMFGTNNLYGAGYTSHLKNNIMYFGTNQGLYKTSFPILNKPLPLQLEQISGIKGQIWSLTEIDKTLFCGSDQGAFIINKNGVEKINELSGTWSFKVLKKHPDLILGCSYQGLFILKKVHDKWMFSHFIKGSFSETGPMFEEDVDESIWFSHWQKGLFRLHLNAAKDSILRIDLFNETKGFPSNRNNTVFRINNELIFSSERGLFRFNRKTNKMQPYEKWNSLFASVPSYIRLHESKNGDVWCVSGRFVGLAKKMKQKSEYKMDSLSYQLLQSRIISGFEHFNFIDSTNLVLSTEDGFCWIDTQKRIISQNVFSVFFRNITPTNDKFLINSGDKSDYKNGDNHIYSHKNNSLRFEYIAPEFRNEGLVRYSFKLENYDQDWSEFSYDNIKEYTQIPKGNYIFKVRARDLLEVNESSYSYAFTILPAWYETKFALIIYIVLLLALLFIIAMWINYRSNKGAFEMEKQKQLEINEQKKKFDEETFEKKREIKELKNQQLQYELRHKAQELATSTMNLIRKNEMLLDILASLSRVTTEIKNNTDSTSVLVKLSKMERTIKENIENENNWKRFEENFDMVYENYLKRLSETYPDLNINDKKLCAYLKMGLSSKDIAPLINASIRSVETNRFRLRKKLNLDREINLSDYLQRF